MTKRRPPGVPIETWAEKQIREAQERGAFDNLPGKGKPLPGAGKPYDESWWIRDYLDRENVPSDYLLPTPLQLRKEIERLPRELASIGSEDIVRERIDELNTRIVEWMRAPIDGPQIPVRRVDVEATVDVWRVARRAVPEAKAPEPVTAPKRSFWRRRR